MRCFAVNVSLAATLAGAFVWAPTASACGGFFCSSAQPVNQTAERIVFARNADDSVTAVIEIQYEGPSAAFSWLLPVGAVPAELRVSSNVAFQRLQAVTNPLYTLTTRVEGKCRSEDTFVRAFAGSAAEDSSGVIIPSSDVSVEASGTVGPYEWTVLSVEDGVAEPAQAAVDWLTKAGYDIPDSAPGLLGPYLSDGMYLLALKLTKDADAGAIRPIVVTYPGGTPMIPLRPTSVAANPDMGVMTWLLGDGRGVPTNYLSLELNEARLNWFNPSSNYNALVIEAANDAGGQGFITEYSDEPSKLGRAVWTDAEQEAWEQFISTRFDNFVDMYQVAERNWKSYDGYLDALDEGIPRSASVSREDFRACPGCYVDQIEFAPDQLMKSLEKHVIEPVRLVQDLLDVAPNVTRLYTTLSPDEMTVDPVFTFNKDLPKVDNVHTAERIIECNTSVLQSDASFRIELPQGDVVRGRPNDVNSGTWPAALKDLPANRLVSKQSDSGKGRIAEDNRETIGQLLADYNATVPGNQNCGCTLVGSSQRTSSWGWAVFGALALLRRGRRERT